MSSTICGRNTLLTRYKPLTLPLLLPKRLKTRCLQRSSGPKTRDGDGKRIYQDIRLNQKNDTPSVSKVVYQDFDARVGILLLGREVVRADKEDYLTAEEVEELREAQEPHLRLKVLRELLEKRLDKAAGPQGSSVVEAQAARIQARQEEECEV